MYLWIKLTLPVCVFLLLATGCARQEKRDTKGHYYMHLFKLWTDTLSHDPVFICGQIDSVLPCIKDSVVYYYAQVVKAKAKMFMSEWDSAKYLLRDASRFCAENSVPAKSLLLLAAEVSNMEGNLYARTAVYDSARMAFSRAYVLCERAGDRFKLYDISLNLADAYEHEGRYDWGSFWYRRALGLADSLRLSDEQRFPVYYGLAQVNMDLRDFGQCDYYFDLAGKYYDRMQPYEKHIYLNNRGNSYYYRHDYPSALAYFRRLLAFTDQYPEMEFERNMTMVNLGEVFLLMDETDSATYYLNQCYPYFQKMGNISALYYMDTQLIELALKENNLPLARKRLREAVKPDFVDPNMLYIRNRYLQHYYERSGDFGQAYHYLKQNVRIDDSIRNERVRMRVAEMALRYQQDSTLMKKEMFIRQKENEVLYLNQWLYGGALVVVLVGMSGFFVLLYRKKKQKDEEQNLRTAITSLRLANIRNRISPHFIFNVLTREVRSVRGTEADTNLKELIKLMRRNLELAGNLAVTLRDELDFVQTYIGLESKNMQPGFAFTVDIAPDMDLTEIMVPAMLLQIPVENALKHALGGKEGKKLLHLRIGQGEESIVISIRDNGGGYRAGGVSEGTGTGMKVITRTLQLLNAYNRRPIVMRVDNVETEEHEAGCEVYFELPLNYSYELKKQKKHFLWEWIRYIGH